MMIHSSFIRIKVVLHKHRLRFLVKLVLRRAFEFARCSVSDGPRSSEKAGASSFREHLVKCSLIFTLVSLSPIINDIAQLDQSLGPNMTFLIKHFLYDLIRQLHLHHNLLRIREAGILSEVC